jgi:trehalose 6-phosphate phosphatase
MSPPRASIEAAAETLARHPAETAIFTDFDGTLSPIVPDPLAARPLPGAVEALRQLAARCAWVGVVSGRPVEFLVERFGREAPAGVGLYGQHGLEHWNGSEIAPVPAALEWVGTVRRARELAVAAAVPELVVEDKHLGITLHWRRATDPDRTAGLAAPLAGRIAEATGLVLHPGKASVEIVPPIGIDKGTVVREVAQHAGPLATVTYLGDDSGDIPAFEAIDALVGSGVAGLKIAVSSAEAPPRLLEMADLVLERPEDAVAVLVETARLVG